jgi:hypothetical protein
MIEFDDNVIEIIRKQDRTVSAANQTFFDSLSATEQRIFAAVSKHVQKFSSDGENYVFDDGNVLLTNQVERIILDALQSSKYPSDVNGFLRNFETLKQYNFDIHGNVNDLSPDELGELINPIQRATVEQTLQGLTGSGVSTNFVEPIRTGIFQNIVAGSTKSDLEAYLRRFILGNPEVDGLLSRYVKQVSRDALNQFDGQVNAKIANQFGLDAYRYVGSLIEDSRPQCRRWVAMGVIQTKDLPAEIAWMNANGTGAIPGTSPETFSIYRGGYNCRHSAIPFKLTKSQREKLNLPEEQQKIEKKATEANANLEAPPAASDFKDLYSYKSKKTPNQLKSMTEIPQILFEYSDNGKMKITGGGLKSKGSFYNAQDQVVRLSFKDARYANANEKGKTKVAIHEFAHRTHEERKKIYFERESVFEGGPRQWVVRVEEKTQQYWEKSVAAFEKKLPDFVDGKMFANSGKLVEKYRSQLAQFSERELYELAGAYSDTIMAISKCRYGAGHDVSYMLEFDQGKAKMEWFAHSFENYFQANPIFQSEFPELFEIMNDYVFNEIVKPYTPKELLN